MKARNFEVQGHRGARAARPENTLSAFKYALGLGVDTLELDLNVTKDNVLVVMHDPMLNPDICLAPGGKKITQPIVVRTLTLKELKKFDCGSLVHPRFPTQVRQPGEKIPTFEEFLSWLKNEKNPRAKTVLLNVETKIEPAHPEQAPEPKAFAKLVIDMAKKYGVLERMTLQSFDFRTLVAAREMEPKIVISALLEERPTTTLAEIASDLKAEIVSPDQTWLSRHDVDSLHAIGVKVIPWTANKAEDWARLVSIGVDGIISDDPKSLLEFRESLLKLSQ